MLCKYPFWRQNVVFLIFYPLSEAKEAANRLSPPDGPVASISDHEKFLKKYSGRVLHPNHVVIVDVKWVGCTHLGCLFFWWQSWRLNAGIHSPRCTDGSEATSRTRSQTNSSGSHLSLLPIWLHSNIQPYFYGQYCKSRLLYQNSIFHSSQEEAATVRGGTGCVEQNYSWTDEEKR